MRAAAFFSEPGSLGVVRTDVNALQDTHRVRLPACRLAIRQDYTIQSSQASLNHGSSKAAWRLKSHGGVEGKVGGTEGTHCSL